MNSIASITEKDVEAGSVLIPLPPTANNIWRIFGSRQHKSSHYLKWLTECVEIVKDEMQPVIGPVRVTVTIRLGKGFPRNRDLDNCIKPCLDLLKPPSFRRADGKLSSPGASIIQDDSVEYVPEIIARVLPAYDKKSDAECWISVRAL